MKHISVFENAEYIGALEKDFYRFCRRRQIGLFKYWFKYILFSLLFCMKVVSVERYYAVRWSFLSSVKELDKKLSKFWRRKKLAMASNDADTIWISEYPDVVLKALAAEKSIPLFANEYNDGFVKFHSLTELFKKAVGGDEACLYDCYRTRVDKSLVSEFRIVDGRKLLVRTEKNGKRAYKFSYRLYDDAKKYLRSCILRGIWTGCMLLASGFALGMLSLYLGAAMYGLAMYKQYLLIPIIVVLNVLPIMLLLLILYFIINRLWVSFLTTSVITLAATFINYYKLLLRNDPMLFSDIKLLFEATEIMERYTVTIDYKVVLAVVLCILGTAFLAVFVRGRVRFSSVRILGVAATVITCVMLFSNIYMNDNIYNNKTANEAMINKWSSTQVYISKGFVYPFIYSVKTSVIMPPDGYDEAAAAQLFAEYEYDDIADAEKVNVIAIMLEAYNDFSKFDEIEFDVDVYSYFHQLQEESWSGELVTNIFAGGTVETEWQFLTGYTENNYFRSDVNSYVRYFDEQGYTVEGSHPCYAWFYNRQNVNEYLGFENYYFYENKYAEMANGGIAPDNILFPEIIRMYEENKETGAPYFSFNVTYQNHGPYSGEAIADTKYIANTNLTDEEYNYLNNYLDGIYDTNQQIEYLIEYFRQEDEPVVVILFGDHNPWMGDGNSVYNSLGISFDFSMPEGFYNYYSTPYVIWANDTAKQVLENDFVGEGPDIGPYFLMNEFFDLAGYEGNEFMKLSDALYESMEAVHVNGVYKIDGELTSQLSGEDSELIDKFINMQYYWRENLRNAS